MPNIEKRIALYLELIFPKGAPCAEIAAALPNAGREEVARLVQELASNGAITQIQDGDELTFKAHTNAMIESIEHRLPTRKLPASLRPRQTTPPHPVQPATLPKTLSAQEFEPFAKQALATRFHFTFDRRLAPGAPKVIALVSADEKLVGDVLYINSQVSKYPPPTVSLQIAGHVWLLERTSAPQRFLVFGGDRNSVLQWLMDYGRLATRIHFYFLSDDGILEELA